MTLIGDLERFFAGVIWPNRLPILLLAIVAASVLVVVAWRGGWLARIKATARRHPARSSVAVTITLAIALPIGWYLASPLLIRTELVEDLPVAVSSPSTPATPGPIGSDAPTTDGPPAAVDVSPAPDPAPLVVSTGSFQDADDFHRGSGTASVLEIEPGRYLLRFEAFSVTNGPDLRVYLSPSGTGYADGALDLGKLKATDGSFNYELPDDFDPGAWASVVIWCEPFAVQFAHAPLATARTGVS